MATLVSQSDKELKVYELIKGIHEVRPEELELLLLHKLDQLGSPTLIRSVTKGRKEKELMLLNSVQRGEATLLNPVIFQKVDGLL